MKLKLFENLITALKEQLELDKKNSDLLGEVFTDSYLIMYPNSIIIEAVISFLEDYFNDEGEWVSYFVYELDFGEKWYSDCVLDSDGKNIPLKTIEDLYNFLIKGKK